MSAALDRYRRRTTVMGDDIREDTLEREKLRVKFMLRDSLSYHYVSLFEDSIIEKDKEDNIVNEKKQHVAIINSDNLDEKYVYSLPGEDLVPGTLFWWADNYWLITDKDANTEVYTRTKAIQCNYLLKWVHVQNGEPVLMEQWCYIEDGTKYMTGELEDRHFIVTRGDARIAMTIARNPYTVKFNRKSRFLVDDDGSDYYLSYDLSKPLKVGHTYNGKGVFKYVLSESNSSVFDNMELGIADYYMYFPEDGASGSDEPSDPGTQTEPVTDGATTGKKVWF